MTGFNSRFWFLLLESNLKEVFHFFPPRVAEKKSKLVQYRNDYNRLNATQSRPHTGGLTFQSSTVTYGGPNGAYYTSSRSRRIGSDGVSEF